MFAKLSLLLLVLLLGSRTAAVAQFAVAYNEKTGALTALRNPTDAYQMNWLLSSADKYPEWQQPTQDWGLGSYVVRGATRRVAAWHTPTAAAFPGGGASTLTYETPDAVLTVGRAVQGSFFTETYRFRNKTDQPLTLDSLRIYTPFNDNYPDATTCVTNRCNAHIWPGLSSAYVNAVRMGGAPPHLGLVFTQGAMQGYVIENRGRNNGGGEYTSSNVRGTIALLLPPVTLPPHQTYTVEWKLFWHRGWDDFFATAKRLGFVRAQAAHYVVRQGEPLALTLDAQPAARATTRTLQPDTRTLGEHSLLIPYGQGKQTPLNYYVVSSPDSLVARRVRFIVRHQQLNDPADPRDGAYMVYDNENNALVTNLKGMTAASDKDEGRERVGMGVLIATWLQQHPNPAVRASLLRYVDFVRRELQTRNYTVYSNIGRTSGNRGYNYPWVANLYLEMYHLTGEKQYLRDYYGTLTRFYQLFGYEFYAIGIPVSDGIGALRQAGLTAESDSLVRRFRRMGDHFVKNSIHYPKHEVNYEQSIVAPAVQFLLELYTVTQDRQYLAEAQRQLPLLEAFSGRQPDAHLNEIAIRHWDGYWFGKRASWGDTMPHYWSMLTAMAYQQVSTCTSQPDYRQRAVRIAENNLLNFKEDGRASCAYLYPAAVNGRPGKFYDPYANDQDWALYYYLRLHASH